MGRSWIRLNYTFVSTCIMEVRNETGVTLEKTVVVPRSATDIQRRKLEKLMKKADKPVVIPERPEAKLPRVFNPPEFIRNIWGSSAGAGSGDFHVYRGVRRREYARQKFEKARDKEEELDDEHAQKLQAIQQTM